MIILMEQFGLHREEGGDAALAVLLALQACEGMEQVTLQFPPNGRYHFHPEDMVEQQLYITNHDQGGTRRIAFPLQGRRNLTIDGQSSEFIFHGQMIPFVLDHSEDVSLRNVTIDWERPMFEQGLVVESTAEFFVVELSDGVPYEVKDDRVHFWFGGKLEPVWGMHDIDPVSKSHAYQSGDRISWGAFHELRVEEAGERRIRVYGELKHQPKIGHIVTMRFGRRENPGIFITGGANIAIEHVTVHHAPGMGLVAQRCTNIHLKHFDVKLRPESPRLVTATADATHFTNCRGTILIEHCLFENQLDDPCNVHGIYSRVVRRIDNDTLLVQLMHEMTIGVEIAVPGDVMQFVHNDSLLGYVSATVLEATALNAHHTLLRFTEPLPDTIRLQDCVENLTWNADLTVRHCTVRANRARGFLITTPGRVVLEHNQISAPGAGIKISGDANSWYESGAVKDVTIQYNTFTSCNYCHPDWGQAVIDIDPEIEHPEPYEACYHRNIRIEHNQFDTFGHGIVFGHSIDGLSFRNNQIRLSEAYPAPEHGVEPIYPITLKAVRNTDLGSNEWPKHWREARINGGLIRLDHTN